MILFKLGRITNKVYGKQINNSLFRRIAPIAFILVWCGICKSDRGWLILIGDGGLL
jgi:hypothetical protein